MKRLKQRKLQKLLCSLAALAISVSLAGCTKYHGNDVPGMSRKTDKFDKIYDIMKNDWYYAGKQGDIDEALIEKALSGMVDFEDDIHTQYLPKEQATVYSDHLVGSNIGIGIVCYKTEDGPMTVKSVFINSPADEANLQAGDQIVSVDGQDTTGMKLEDVIVYIKASDGKPMQMEIMRDGTPMHIEMSAKTYDSTVSFDEEDDYGLISLTSFSQNSGKDTVEAMKRLEQDGVKNLILDLRDNGGGYVHAAKTIANALLPIGSVVFQETTPAGRKKPMKTDDDSYQASFDHIYILQNGNSASASEVLIGALKDNIPDKVTTVGTQSYGKGTEQLNEFFDDGTSLKYTVAEWLTPNGTSINKVGFTPDVPVELDEYMTVSYRDMEDEEAIQPDTVHQNAAAVQVYLRFLGYPAERSDAYFAPASSEALKQFQQDKGLEATGTVDAKTFEKLVTAVSEKINTSGYEQDAIFQKALGLIRGTETIPDPQTESSPETDQNAEEISESGENQSVETDQGNGA